MAPCVIPFESMLVQRLEVSNQVDSAFDFRKYLYKSAQKLSEPKQVLTPSTSKKPSKRKALK